MSFGKGKGKGGKGGAPFIQRDEDGNALAAIGPVKPPALFPPVEALPPLPKVTERDQHLLMRRRQLNSSYRSSPYYLEHKKKARERDIDRYSDRYTNKDGDGEKLPLNGVLTLNQINFPSELFGKSVRGKTKGILSGARGANKATEDMLKLEELATMESSYAAEVAQAELAALREGHLEGELGIRKKPIAGVEEEDEEPEEDDGEEDEEQDDYMQGEEVDDDDGYEDDDFGGGDDDDGGIF
ncbi:hypothetical protein CYMTET_50283 [Cymbomonas tetramitiformis]|uniref:DNA-directed RNA polymerase III subunit n=1 Tax=Cymbomonas tetramitiformis TaxID=36881 RepID=A0AAE0ETN1_9CHLO|nr:hypothetical protein CYMTET_50283 [Cymbomonas tetramitiformis]